MVRSERVEIITRNAVYNAGYTNFIHNKVMYIDEHQHASYNKLKNEIKCNGLIIITGLSWVIIRFNPYLTRKEKPHSLGMITRKIQNGSNSKYSKSVVFRI